MTKYGSHKVTYQGHSFASKLEAAVYQILMLRMRAKEIDSIQCQDHVYLTLARISYIADFRCVDSKGDTFWVEAKGFPTPEWAIKKKLWKFYGEGRLELWTGSHRSPKLTEEIIPRESA